MPDEHVEYGDSQDRIDYQVIKSTSGSVHKQSAYSLSSFGTIIFTIFIITGLLISIFSQAFVIQNLETRLKKIETKVEKLENQIEKVENQKNESKN